MIFRLVTVMLIVLAVGIVANTLTPADAQARKISAEVYDVLDAQEQVRVYIMFSNDSLIGRSTQSERATVLTML